MTDKARILTMLHKGLPEDINAEISLLRETARTSRFSNSIVSENDEIQELVIQVTVEQNGRIGSYSSNWLTVSGIRETLAKARENAKTGRPGPLVLTGSTGYREMELWHSSTARQGPESRVALLGPVMSFAEKANLDVTGVLCAREGELAIVNTAGLSAWSQTTFAEFHASVTSGDWFGLGHGYSCNRDVVKLDVISPVLEASAKCQASGNPRDLPSGDYTVILEPAAVADLMTVLAQTVFNGRTWSEGLSPVVKLGTRIFGENITIWDDGLDPKGLAVPFDYEGVPKHRLNLVTRGVVHNLALDNDLAARLNMAVTGHAAIPPNPIGPLPTHIFMEAGNAMLDDMIASTKRGILVSRLRNMAVLDSRGGLLTGVTGNGTLLVENGKLVAAVPSMRFVQNIVQALNRVEMIGDETRLFGGLWGSTRVPAMKIHKFNILGCQIGAGRDII
jgi:predicted Zn-dependent protease